MRKKIKITCNIGNMYFLFQNSNKTALEGIMR